MSLTGDFPQSLRGRGEYYTLKVEKYKILSHGCILIFLNQYVFAAESWQHYLGAEGAQISALWVQNIVYRPSEIHSQHPVNCWPCKQPYCRKEKSSVS